jgi:DNA-directed RNA polymerase specialized sigma24 family protein
MGRRHRRPGTLDDAIEARRALERLAELPPHQRRDLALRVAGFTYREICKITGGRSYTNVNKHLRKARARIRLEELRNAGAKTQRRSSSCEMPSVLALPGVMT